MRNIRVVDKGNQSTRWMRGWSCSLGKEGFHYFLNTPQSEKTQMIPKRPVVYDPFDYYYPKGKGPGGKKSVYLLFADLPDAPEAICTFLEDYGPLHLAGLLKAEAQQIVNFQDPPDPLKDVLSAIHTFRALLTLCQGHNEQRIDLVNQVKGIPLLVANQGQWKPIPHPTQLKEVQTKIRLILSRQLEGMTFVPCLDKDTKCWGHRWTFRSLLSIFYYMLFLDLERAGYHRQCPVAEYGCGAFFVTWRASTVYCSEQCQKRAKVRRMRDPDRKSRTISGNKKRP